MGKVTILPNSLGERIKYLRDKNQLTQQELADKLFIQRGVINYYEKNVRIPSADKIKGLALIFDVTTDFLLCMTDNEKIENIAIGNDLHLSDDAIYMIRNLENYCGQETDDVRKAISSFIGNYYFGDLICEIIECKKAYKKRGEILEAEFATRKLLESLTLEQKKLIEEKGITILSAQNLFNIIIEKINKKVFDIVSYISSDGKYDEEPSYSIRQRIVDNDYLK